MYRNNERAVYRESTERHERVEHEKRTVKTEPSRVPEEYRGSRTSRVW